LSAIHFVANDKLRHILFPGFLDSNIQGIDLFNNYAEMQRKIFSLIFTENCYLKCHFKGVDLFNDYAEMQRNIFGLIFTENCY
jgi:small basic protein